MGWEASRYPTIYLVPLAKKGSATPSSSAEAATDLAAPKNARKEYEKGSRALHSGNLEEARKHLEKAVAEDPCYARAQTALGLTLSMQQQFAAAESAFNQSIKCDGGFLPAYLQLAILLKAQKKYKECEATLQQGLRLFPNEWRLHYQLGNAHDGSGDYATAEQEFLKAQSINSEVPSEFHLRLASMYLNWKKYDKAHAEMETYLRADPDGRFAEPTRKMMQQMEASGMVASSKRRTDQTKP
jgi:tetratricopeptide (TPR) repeat protein